jgi:hypothetical protein
MIRLRRYPAKGDLPAIGNLQVRWIDRYREPQVKPNPLFPNGVHLDASEPGERACQTPLPYPAKRCGIYVVTCPTCGFATGCTTAGRIDDPRSLRIGCGSRDAEADSESEPIPEPAHA